MNVEKLEELVAKLAKDIKSGNQEVVAADLQSLEFFAHGAQGFPQTDPVSEYILNQARSIGQHLNDGYVTEAGIEIARLGGYVSRLSQESVQHTTNGRVRYANQDLVYIAGQREARIGNREVLLSNNEAQLLGFFYEHPNVVLSREDIDKGAWNGRKTNKSTFWYPMNRLLNKIQPDTNGPQYVKLFHRKGWMFSPDPNNFSYPSVGYDTKSGLVRIDNIDMQLRGKEKEVMDFLYLHKNITYSIGEISRGIWTENADQYSVVKNVMHRLRNKLIIDPHMLSPIIGTQSKGYMLKV